MKIEALTRFPIKGLSGEALDGVTLEAGQGFPGDRKFGFARPNSGFVPADPKPLPKTEVLHARTRRQSGTARHRV